MGKTIEDMDEGIEHKDIRVNYVADEKGISDEQVVHEMERVNLNEILDKTDGVMKR